MSLVSELNARLADPRHADLAERWEPTMTYEQAIAASRKANANDRDEPAITAESVQRAVEAEAEIDRKAKEPKQVSLF